MGNLLQEAMTKQQQRDHPWRADVAELPGFPLSAPALPSLSSVPGASLPLVGPILVLPFRVRDLVHVQGSSGAAFLPLWTYVAGSVAFAFLTVLPSLAVCCYLYQRWHS